MRWVWRVLFLFLLAYFLKSVAFAQPTEFISWPQGQNWNQRISYEIKQWQSFSQDLPESLEVEIRQLFRDFKSSGSGQEV